LDLSLACQFRFRFFMGLATTAPVHFTAHLITDTGVMGTARIGATDTTAVTMVADTTAAAIMVVATIEGVTMADVPTTIIIGTIDPSLISER